MSIHSYRNTKGEQLYRVTFRANGKQLTRRGIKTKSEAKNIEAEERIKYLSGNIQTDSKIMLGDYLSRWHSRELKGIRNVGAYHHQRIGQYLKHINKELGHIRLKNIKPSDAVILREKYQKNALLANQTIRLMESCLKGAIKDAVLLGYLNKSPLEHFKILTLELEDKKKIQVFEKDEQALLIETARNYASSHDDQRWFLRPYLALNTGMRSGEIAGLQWGDIDFEGKTITVERNVHYAEGDTKGKVKKPKTKASLRTIYLTDTNVSELNKYRLWISEKLLKAKVKISEDTFVLMDNDSGILHRSAARKRWETIVRQAGLTHRGFHALRHTHASNLIDQDLNPKVISVRMGHESISMTMDTYGHLFKKENQLKTEEALKAWEAQTF